MDRKLIEKVKKLLALSKSSNEHEAKLALEKANKIIEEYNLSLRDIEESDMDVTQYTGMGEIIGSYVIHNWCQLLAQKTAQFTDCHIVLGYGYQGKNQYYPNFIGKINVLGHPEDIEIFLYIFQYLFRTLKKAVSTFKKETNASRSQIRSFCYGFVHGVGAKMDQLKKHRAPIYTSTGRDLVVVKESMIKRYMEETFKQLGSKKMGTSRVNRSAYEAGIEKGKKTPINAGVKGGSPGSGPALLD